MENKERESNSSIGDGISVSAIKSQILDQTSQPPESFRDARNAAHAEALELQARSQFIRLRGNWSVWLISWICFLLLFQAYLSIAVGANWLNFEKYQWFLPLVVTENFGQIIGMGLIIVRFLYPPAKLNKALDKSSPLGG